MTEVGGRRLTLPGMLGAVGLALVGAVLITGVFAVVDVAWVGLRYAWPGVAIAVGVSVVAALLGIAAVLVACWFAASAVTRLLERAIRRGDPAYVGFVALVAGVFAGLATQLLEFSPVLSSIGGAVCALGALCGALVIRKRPWLGFVLYLAVAGAVTAGAVALQRPDAWTWLKTQSAAETAGLIFLVLLMLAAGVVTLGVERRRRVEVAKRHSPVPRS